MTDRHEMEAVIEAILFVAHDPISRQKLLEAFGDREREAAGLLRGSVRDHQGGAE